MCVCLCVCVCVYAPVGGVAWKVSVGRVMTPPPSEGSGLHTCETLHLSIVNSHGAGHPENTTKTSDLILHKGSAVIIM